MGRTRKLTSFNTSVSTPPSPNMMIGPNWGSSSRPMMISTPSVTISWTSMPSIRAAGWAASAAAMMSVVALADFVRGPNVEDHAADVGLVQDVGR